jgi:hypothetical protein
MQEESVEQLIAGARNALVVAVEKLSRVREIPGFGEDVLRALILGTVDLKNGLDLCVGEDGDNGLVGIERKCCSGRSEQDCCGGGCGRGSCPEVGECDRSDREDSSVG